MKKILLGVVVLVVLGGVGNALSSGKGTADKGASAATSESAPKVASTKGKQPMRWGNWELVGKIRVQKGFYDDFDPHFRVRNLKDEADSGIFTVTFLEGNAVLGTTECTTDQGINAFPIAPGEVGPVMMCSGDDQFKRGWTEITIKDTY